MERPSGLASGRGPRSRQGPQRSRPEWIHRGAISPDFVGGSIMFRRFLFAVPIAALALGSTTACASKKFVRTSVSEVNDKVDSLGRSVEETQERTRRNEGRISEVDQKAGAAGDAAVAGQNSANQARRRASAPPRRANPANAKAAGLDKGGQRP